MLSIKIAKSQVVDSVVKYLVSDNLFACYFQVKKHLFSIIYETFSIKMRLQRLYENLRACLKSKTTFTLKLAALY